MSEIKVDEESLKKGALEAADKIKEYLIIGMHYSTSGGQKQIALIIEQTIKNNGLDENNKRKR